MRRACLAALAVVVLLPLPQSAASRVAGTIRGRVEARQPGPTVDARPSVSELGMPQHRERDPADSRRAVVYLPVGPQPAFDERDETRATMDQRGETFVPHVLAITTGTTVDFPNSDRIYHNVFSLSKPRSFDLGRYATGRSKAVRFDRPGIVRVFCDIHSHMSAFILVFAHRYYSVTDDEGRYRIDNVPPGTYAVNVWHETLSGPAREARIPDEGGVVELNFVLR